MILVFDIGNTFCKTTLFSKNNKIIKFRKFKSKVNFQEDVINNFKKNKIDYIVVGSVVNHYKSKVKYIAKALQTKLKILDSNDFRLVKMNLCTEIDEIGLDILSATYFLFLKKENALAISYGTFTFSCIFSNLKLQGVIISPSFSLIDYKNYFKKADLINNYKISFSEQSLSFGIDTSTSISSGLLYYFLGYINLIWTNNSKEFNLTKIYLSGGNMIFLKNSIFFKILKNLTGAEIIIDDQIISKGYLFLFHWLKINSKL